MNTQSEFKNLDIIPTLNWGEDWLTKEDVIADILEQHRDAGYKKFIVFYPSCGYFSKNFPSLDIFENGGKIFKEIKDAVAPYGISLGWWLRMNLNQGHESEAQHLVNSNGIPAAYSVCPLDKSVQKTLSKSIAIFAKNGKPDLIILEDDFTVSSAGKNGCMCDLHIQEFSERENKVYTREELSRLLEERTPEAIALLKRWRKFTKDSLVELATAIRTELDKESPEIPVGHMEAGANDSTDGNACEEISRALAGKNHTPFARIFSCLYQYQNVEGLPFSTFNSLYKIQHIKGDFIFYHETDTYPHTRYYTSAGLVKSAMGAVYSIGFDGSTFNNAQFNDNQNEERIYNKMLSSEYKRLNEVHRIAKQCSVKGVTIDYDPFYNTIDRPYKPLWLNCLPKFGIPLTTKDSEVAFWDEKQAEYKDDAEIIEALSKGLFLDGDAARILCKRGYSKYLGVMVGDGLCKEPYYSTWSPSAEPLSYDIASKEVICEKFVGNNKGRNMTSPYMYAPRGYGNILKMTVSDPACEVITEFYGFEKNLLTVSMTRFENSLGGRVVVMGITLKGNNSHSLINYRRQRLIQEQIDWCGGEVVYVKNEPSVYTIMNEAINPDESGFVGMITLINLCSDRLDEVKLHLPSKWQNLKEFCVLNQNGEWRTVSYEKEYDTLLVKEALNHLEPIYIIAKN